MHRIGNFDKKKPYMNLQQINYFSERYQKTVIVRIGFQSDGATGAIDIDGPHPVLYDDGKTHEIRHVSRAWLVHDKICETGCWSDGTPLNNWQCSMVIKDILKSEGRWLRDFWWGAFTWLIGGGEARKNGMW